MWCCKHIILQAHIIFSNLFSATAGENSRAGMKNINESHAKDHLTMFKQCKRFSFRLQNTTIFYLRVQFIIFSEVICKNSVNCHYNK